MIYNDVLQNPSKFNFEIPELGQCLIDTPLKASEYIGNDERIAFSSQIKNIIDQLETKKCLPSFEKAGPRKKIFFDPFTTKAAIVTCGGLCPGLNTVVKGIVKTLIEDYRVKNIVGIRYGYKGLTRNTLTKPIKLTSDFVDQLHSKGGTCLGSSRGNQRSSEMVDQLVDQNINLLFCIGGDGTLKGAQSIANEITKRGLEIGVVGIPKTIDNDLSFVEKTFGFETSVEIATQIITSAHCEAESAEYGVGIVKLMGRDSGFIAANSSLANSVVDFCLIPEFQFTLEGENGLLKSISKRLEQKKHLVIVVAEGAGQSLFADVKQRKDDSGNILKDDIGSLLKEKISNYFISSQTPITIKYLDPSYYIRSVPPVASDAIFCYQLAEHAVHAGMSGKTNMVVGHWNNFFTHTPISLATTERKMVDLKGALWRSVMSSTQQNI